MDFAEEPSLFQFIELKDHLSTLLGVKVDLVMRDTLKPLIGCQILSEVVGLTTLLIAIFGIGTVRWNDRSIRGSWIDLSAAQHS